MSNLWTLRQETRLHYRDGRGQLHENALPIGQIYGMGQNYASHAAEMGIDPSVTPPVFFCKGRDCLWNAADHDTLPLPSASDDIQPEVELALILARDVHQVSKDAARDAIFGFAVALDMTRRDLQRAARMQSLPWDMAKHFIHSAPCGIVTAHQGAHQGEWHGGIELRINGTLRQQDSLDNRLWDSCAAIAALSHYQHLYAGDMILTGTPAGVSPVLAGDVLEASIDGLDAIHLTCR